MYSIFPTQIGVYDIPFDKNLINEVMKDYKLKPINVLNGSKSSYLTETGTKFLEDNRLKDLLYNIYLRLDDYTNNLSLVPCDISTSWFNNMDNGGSVALHRHQGSVISGALYIDVSKNPSPIKFKNPLIPYKMMELYTDDPNYHHCLDIYEGLLILFPSWLEHETLPQNGIRSVVSFNTLHKGANIDNII